MPRKSPLVVERLESRRLLAASSPSDAAEAWVLMNCPNDFKDDALPPLIASIATMTNDADQLRMNRLSTASVQEIFSSGFEAL